MRASTACVRTTPQGTFYMDGYGSPERQHPAVGVHDDPYCVLLMLEDNGAEILFCSLDVCNADAEHTAPLRALLSEATGVAQDRIVISTIHSHSCPTGFRGNGLVKGESTGYCEMVTGLAAQTATGLRDALVEVTPEILRTTIRGWYSNRNSAEKPFDDEAFVIRFVGADGKNVAAMANFNCHATVVGPKNMYLTTDVQGGVRAELAKWLGVMPYEFTGASGDLGNRQFRRGNDFAELARVINGIAGVIMDGTFEPVELAGPQLREWVYKVDYDNTQYYDHYQEQLDKSQAVLDNPDSSFDDKKLAATQVKRLAQKLETPHVNFDILMRIYDMGSVVFVTFPGELGSTLGMRIKGMFKDKVAIVIGYANGAEGYFVPAGDFGLGYESYVTKLPQGGIEKVLDAFEEQL